MPRFNECLLVAGGARLLTWSYVEVAGAVYHRNPELTVVLLKIADGKLGLNETKDTNDPVIARDLGGDEILWDVRHTIRDAIECFEKGLWRLGNKKIRKVRRVLYINAIRRIIQCILDESIEPATGVSRKKAVRKLLKEMDDSYESAVQ